MVVYNGSTWTAPSPATGAVKQAITALDCPTTTYCAATANGGGLTTYNGSTWSGLVRPAGSDQAASASWKVSCASATFCVGNDGLGNALTYDGSSWRVRARVAAGVWNSISCVRTDFCVAVGAANGDSEFVYNGAAWQPGATKSPSPTTSPSVLSCTSDAFCLLVNTRGYASTGTS